MAAPRLNFNRTTVSDPTQAASRSLAAAQSTLSDWQRNNLAQEQAAAQTKQQEFANNLATQQAGIQQANANRLQSKYDRDLAQEVAASNIASEYNPITYADTSAMDNTVLSNLNKVTPQSLQGVGELPSGPDNIPVVTQDEINRLTNLQGLYEKQAPTEEAARAGVLQNALKAGVPFEQADKMAKTLTTDLISQPEALAAAQKKSDAQNALALENWKMDNKLNIADKNKGTKSSTGGSGGGSVASNYTKALSGISAKQWIGGDRQDAIDASNEATTNMIKAGYTPDQAAAIMVGLLQESSGSTDWTNSDVEFNSSIFENQLEALQKDPVLASRFMKSGMSTGGTPATPVARTAMPTMTTAGDYLTASKKASDLSNASQLQKILGIPVTESPVIGGLEDKPVKDKIKEVQERKVKGSDNTGTVKDPIVLTTAEFQDIFFSGKKGKDGLTTDTQFSDDANGNPLPEGTVRLNGKIYKLSDSDVNATVKEVAPTVTPAVIPAGVSSDRAGFRRNIAPATTVFNNGVSMKDMVNHGGGQPGDTAAAQFKSVMDYFNKVNAPTTNKLDRVYTPGTSRTGNR